MGNTRLRILFLVAALIIVVASVLFTNNLANNLADEERKKIEIWADATRQFILADEHTDVDFVSSIIENNTTIPVYMVDAEGNFLLSRNVEEPKQNVGEFYKEKIAELREIQEPIEVRVSDDVRQYIYYDESTLLKQLYYFPYVQFTIIFLFIFISLYVVDTMQKTERNSVWIGLTKETAHQLGTPISSLLAWQEILEAKYPNDELLPEMSKDVERLQVIADRFSKIGSEPNMEKVDVLPILQETIAYMQKRTSTKVEYVLDKGSWTLDAGACTQAANQTQDPVRGERTNQTMVEVNKPLFSWVVENICKNAVDAMEGRGKITIFVKQKVHNAKPKALCIDITDTGKGIAPREIAKVFNPGYTTKQRGWGLGLSLAKRIVEEYHGGKIYVAKSVLGQGTTFRIEIPLGN